MKTPKLFVGLASGMVALGMNATDFPLHFKSLDLEKALAFGGGYGASAGLSLNRPAALKKEPKAISSYPIYGRIADVSDTNRPGFLFRLDESKGTGKGYDTLLLDVNQNGDLTDDTFYRAVKPEPKEDRAVSTQNRRFGPIQVPADRRIGEWRPIYYAQCYVYGRDLSAARKNESTYLGSLRLKAGWYLEAKADFKGAKHSVAVYDANSNLRLGDLPTTRVYDQTNWYFIGGDMLLLDADNSGSYESSMTNNEVSLMGPLLYDGATPYKVALAADCKTLRLDPWDGPLAEVSLQPQGKEVRTLTLAWEQTPDHWQAIKTRAAGAKISVPPGNYRLYSCDLLTKGADGTLVMARGYNRSVRSTLSFQSGQGNTLLCGAPLEVNVTARADRPVSVAAGSSVRSRLSALVRTSEQENDVRVNAVVIGKGGELYSSYWMGLEGTRPPKPKFNILAMNGKEVASGNLEFG